MRILFLSDNFPPEVNAPASRTAEHCREWVRLGHEVTVITCSPNFPTGCIFPGYRNRLVSTEEVDGVRVVRVWTYVTANEGFLKRTADYLSYALAASIAGVSATRFDVVVATSPQFFTACAGWLVGFIRRRPFVFEVRDLWPESIKAVGAMKDGLVLRLLEGLELFLYRRAAAVITVTEAFKRNLVSRGLPAEKISVVTNGADLSRFTPRVADAELVQSLGLTGTFVAGYVGTHGMAHGLETLIDAAALVSKRPDAEHIRFLLLGDGAEKANLLARAKTLNLSNVIFVDSVSKDQVARYWSLLDVSIIHLRDTPLFETVIPSKLFECMAMGIPVLHGVRGESADIVRRHQVGLTFAAGRPEELANAIVSVAADADGRRSMSARGEIAARSYDRTLLARRMLEILRDLVETRASRRPSLDTGRQGQ